MASIPFTMELGSEFNQQGASSLPMRIRQPATGALLEIHPGLGALCTRWQVPHRGELLDLLWYDREQPDQVHPAKQGIPILFPFPNRLRHGHFIWESKEFQLPRNDPTGRHAIHGLVATLPWRLADHEISSRQVNCTLAIESPGEPLWPAAGQLSLTVAWTATSLSMRFNVRSLADKPFPFGLGVHPYWAWPPCNSKLFADSSMDQLEMWELIDCLPTGKRRSLTSQEALLTQAKTIPLGDTHWDHAFRTKQLPMTWYLVSPEKGVLATRCSSAFRDFVLFTPPHRQAICVEPYTCITDAIHLQGQSVDTGWTVLQPLEEWQGTITWSWHPEMTAAMAVHEAK